MQRHNFSSEDKYQTNVFNIEKWKKKSELIPLPHLISLLEERRSVPKGETLRVSQDVCLTIRGAGTRPLSRSRHSYQKIMFLLISRRLSLDGKCENSLLLVFKINILSRAISYSTMDILNEKARKSNEKFC